MSEPADSPQVQMTTSVGTFVLTWYNTNLRTFSDKQFDHIEFVDEGGRIRGIIVTGEVMDLLFEKHFPYQFSPFVDEATFEWFVSCQMSNLEADLAGGGDSG